MALPRPNYWAHGGARREWTDPEIATLKEWYPLGGAKAVVAHGVNRSESGIRKMAQNHHLSCNYVVPLSDSVAIRRLVVGAAQRLGMTPAKLAGLIATMSRDGCFDYTNTSETAHKRA